MSDLENAPSTDGGAMTPAPDSAGGLTDDVLSALDQAGVPEYDVFDPRPREGDDETPPTETDQPAGAASQRPRDARGKFVKKPQANAGDGAPEAPEEAVKEAAVETAEATPAPVAAVEPPARFSAAAKQAWAGVPDAVRSEVERALTELEGGIRHYQERHKALEPYEKVITGNGDTLPNYLAQVSQLERAMLQDPATAIVQQLAMVKRHVPDLSLEDVLVQALDKAGSGEAASAEMTQMSSRVQQLEADLRQRAQREAQRAQAGQRMQQAQRELQMFQASGQAPRLKELWPDVQKALQSPFVDRRATPQQRLLQAYQMAERLKPAPPPEPTPAPQPTAQTSRAAQSVIAGAPSNGAAATTPAFKNTRDSVLHALSQAGI